MTFTCEVSEDNRPARWLKNGVELSPSDTVKMEVDGKVHRLIITDAKPDDQAEYSIIVRGQQSSAPLTVEGTILLIMMQ